MKAYLQQTKLHIKTKCDAQISNNGHGIKTSFLITRDINHMVILGTPFINLITPYKVSHLGISFKHNSHKLLFPFLEQRKTRELNILHAKSILQNQMEIFIKEKIDHLKNLKQDISLQKISKQLLSKSI